MTPGKKAVSKMYKHPKAKTLYLTIPADIVKEENFPFKEGELIKIVLDTDKQIITLSKFE